MVKINLRNLNRGEGMKLLDKPRDIRLVKRKKGEKVKIYYCDNLEYIDGRLYATISGEKIICIGNMECWIEIKEGE